MIKFIKTINGYRYVENYVGDSLEKNGVFFPDIERVVWALDKKADSEPVLKTTVWFSDGTFVTVKNTADDKISVCVTELSDGSVIKTADKASKERGVVYAVFKRVFGKYGVDENGNQLDSVVGGIGGVISRAFKSGTDCNVTSAEKKIRAAACIAAAKKAKAEAAKPKPKQYNLKDVLQLIGPVLEKMNAGVKTEDIEKELLLETKKPAGKKAAKKPAGKKAVRKAVK